MNFDNMTVEFFKNGESQGIAFDILEGPVYGGVSVTGQGTSIRLLTSGYETMVKYKEKALEKMHMLESVKVAYGNVWDTEKLSDDVFILEDQITVESRAAKNKYCVAASLVSYSSGRRYFEMQIVCLQSTGSSWKVSIGVLTGEFDFKNPKSELGSKNSWAYIARSGNKFHNSNRPQSYAQKYGLDDRIGCLMDFENRTIEFFKNGKSCGEAFNNLTGPVFAACSISGSGVQVRLDGQAEAEHASTLVLYS